MNIQFLFHLSTKLVGIAGDAGDHVEDKANEKYVYQSNQGHDHVCLVLLAEAHLSRLALLRAIEEEKKYQQNGRDPIHLH